MKFENINSKFVNDSLIVQNGHVTINEFTTYDVWELCIEDDAGEHTKLCLYDTNNMLMGSIDIDLIDDIDIDLRDHEGNLI